MTWAVIDGSGGYRNTYRVIRILRSLSVGFALACALLAPLGLGHDDPGWWLPTAAIIAISTIVLTGIAGAAANAAGMGALRPAPSADTIATAEREGRLHLAKVLDIKSTGTLINNNPVAELRLVVATSARAPYTTRTRALIDQVRLPQFQPGNIVVVLQDKADAPRVALVQSPPQSWREKAEKAEDSARISRLGDAPEWSGPAPSSGGMRDARGILRIPAAVLVLLLVVGFAARLYPVRADITAIVTGTPLAEVAAAQELRVARENSTLNPERVQEVIDDFVAEAGHSRFTSVRLGWTHASATMPTAPGANTTDDLTWRNGGVSGHDPSLIQPSDDELPLQTFDAADVDWDELLGLADRLPQQAGFQPDDVAIVFVEVPPSAFNDASLPYEIDVSGSGPYYDATVTYNPDGEVINMYGGAEGSEIAEWEANH
ncbi:hypothetical protein AB1046_11180 [Promicromonospora sp. Populi]|uniref:hypothetical protein n=1 Tax=Promicromonospora sp. Populi TaxID=3239420 RepID=UPI0034E2D3A0